MTAEVQEKMTEADRGMEVIPKAEISQETGKAAETEASQETEKAAETEASQETGKAAETEASREAETGRAVVPAAEKGQAAEMAGTAPVRAETDAEQEAVRLFMTMSAFPMG